MTTTPADRTVPPRAWAVTALAAVLHLAVLAPYLSSGLLAPGWAVLLLLGVWAGLAALVWRLRGNALALLVPGVAVALWFAALTAGEQLLGWINLGTSTGSPLPRERTPAATRTTRLEGPRVGAWERPA